MPHQLRDIEIKEISFVTKGASGDKQHAPKVIFWKGRPMPEKPSFLDRLKGVFTKADEGSRTPEQMLEDLKSQLSPEQQDILMLLLAAAKASPPTAATETPAPAPEAKPAEPEKAEPEDEKKEDEPEEMAKLLDENPKLAEHLAKISESRKADRDEIAELRKAADEHKADKRREMFRKQVQEYTWLPGDHDEVAAMMDEVDQKLTQESQEALAGLIRATDGIVRKASGRLFGENGTSRSGDGTESAKQKLEAAAQALVKEHKENKKKLSIEKARVLVMKNNRELRSELDQQRQ